MIAEEVGELHDSSARKIRLTRLATPVAGLALLVTACGSGGGSAPTTTTATTAAPTTSTTPSGVTASGPRTVLSPVGLNVRQSPDRTAKVLGTAAPGVVLTVEGYSATNGGWYKVRGETVTGWISADPNLSAPGTLREYTGNVFTALYPSSWQVATRDTKTVEFEYGSSPDSVLVTASTTAAGLPDGRSGYGRVSSSSVVVCGLTTDLVTYRSDQGGSSSTSAAPTTTSAPTGAAGGSTTTNAGGGTAAPSTGTGLAYLSQIRVTLGAHDYLGIYANLSDLGPGFTQFRQLVASMTFPAKQCLG